MVEQQLEKRLEELKAELDSGKKIAAELEAKQINIRSTMLRISGAIQVLEELLKEESLNSHEADPSLNGLATASVDVE